MRQGTDKSILLKSTEINSSKNHEAIREQRRVVEMKGPALAWIHVAGTFKETHLPSNERDESLLLFLAGNTWGTIGIGCLWPIVVCVTVLRNTKRAESVAKWKPLPSVTQSLAGNNMNVGPHMALTQLPWWLAITATRLHVSREKQAWTEGRRN